jgi:ABC-type nitrate/sulfonate/bicarbonate transport system ATPase subunit
MGLSEAKPELLQFQSVSKTFIDEKGREVHALEGVTFSLTRGEFVSVLGPSGCGKTTLLRLAAGLERPTSGRVLFRGKEIDRPDRQRGFVFQSYNAFPWLTVRQNIEFGLNGMETAQREIKVSKWLYFTGLSEFADVYPKNLSGGMRQRLALARTMIVEPELLLLDEPFGALDEVNRETMQTLLLRAVADSGCSVLFVTHDIREAILLADRVIVLSSRPGKILEVFTPPSDKPRTRAYLNTPGFDSLYESVLDQFPA